MDDEKKDEIPEETPSKEEGNQAISADLIRGHINTIILRTLYERDKYGYEIIEEIESKSHGQYTLKQPTLYSALKRLESQGYITAYWKTDEVSQGGRRKYYTLTDSGREVAEKNQAEWEYSRTVIDSLISDRNFDFTQPPPTAVDFKILKSSTTRVPVIKDEDGETVGKVEPVREVKVDDEVVTATEKPAEPVVAETPAPAPAPVETVVTERAVAETVVTEATETKVDTVATSDDPMSDSERKKVHENYLKLISTPVEPVDTPPTPVADEIDTEKLIYNNKPETERDYKNLINNLFAKTVTPRAAVAAAPVRTAVETSEDKKRPAVTARYEDAKSKGESDGLTVKETSYETSGARRKKYNLGALLFKCSLIVGVILLFEFAMSLIFRNDLGVSLAYPFVIFAIGCAEVMIFGVLYATEFGKNAKKPATLTYLSASIVVTVIAILIICVTSILIGVNFASAGDVVAKLVLPCIIALNIPAFTLSFYLFNKQI